MQRAASSNLFVQLDASSVRPLLAFHPPKPSFAKTGKKDTTNIDSAIDQTLHLPKHIPQPPQRNLVSRLETIEFLFLDLELLEFLEMV